jgi:hypothetical protein
MSEHVCQADTSGGARQKKLGWPLSNKLKYISHNIFIKQRIYLFIFFLKKAKKILLLKVSPQSIRHTLSETKDTNNDRQNNTSNQKIYKLKRFLKIGTK